MSADFEVQELFTIQQLAEFIHKKPASIYSDTLRRTHSLPPILRIPGCKKLLFVNPHKWASDLLAGAQKVEESQPPVPARRRRGAPTKGERLEKSAGRK